MKTLVNNRARILLLACVIALLPPASVLRAVDCNDNGIEDACDISCGEPGGACDVPGCGTASDCNLNDIPDACDLGELHTDLSPEMPQISTRRSFAHTFLDLPVAGTDVTLTITARGVFDGPQAYLDIYAETMKVGRVFESTGHDCPTDPDVATLTIDAAAFNSLADQGTLMVTLVYAQEMVTLECGDPATFVQVGIDYHVTTDCNTNGILDECDIASGTSSDVNANEVPDDCEYDCNANGIPDEYELATGAASDCNSNGELDECDLATGSSQDCDGNGVPDECDDPGAVGQDCNNNGRWDSCDIADGTSDDCNANQIPDECETGPVFTAASGRLSPFYYTASQFYRVESVPRADDTVTITIRARGDFGSNTYNCHNQNAEVYLNGNYLGTAFYTDGNTCPTTPDEAVYQVSPYTYNDIIAGGAVTVQMIPNFRVDSDCPGEGSYVEVTLAYPVAGDANSNGMLDFCEFRDGLITDCNSNGFLDDHEPDLNDNAVPDDCDIAAGTSQDCDTDGVPDEIQTDCNTNDTPDTCDIAGGASNDCNTNGVPDECDLTAYFKGFPTQKAYAMSGYGEDMTAGDVDGDGDIDIVVKLYYSDTSDVFLNDGNGNFHRVTFAPMTVALPLAMQLSDLNGDGLPDIVVLDESDGWVNVQINQGGGVFGPAKAYGVGAYPRDLKLVDLDGDGSTDILTVNSGTHDIAFLRNRGDGTFDRAAFYRMGYFPYGIVVEDFNSDGRPDVAVAGYGDDYYYTVTVALNTDAPVDTDCNLNDILDRCESTADCNHNGQLDLCELFQGTAGDCNGDTVLDECEPDNDGDTVPDECDDDDDNDGVPDGDDNCPMTSNTDQADRDGDGLGDLCDACPKNIPGIEVDATGCAAVPVPGDMDRDGDVDLNDFGLFQRCLSGVDIPQTDTDCQAANLSGDTDVDGEDVLLLRQCFSGTFIPGDPACTAP